jgi:hypothetical protein
MSESQKVSLKELNRFQYGEDWVFRRTEGGWKCWYDATGGITYEGVSLLQVYSAHCTGRMHFADLVNFGKNGPVSFVELEAENLEANLPVLRWCAMCTIHHFLSRRTEEHGNHDKPTDHLESEIKSARELLVLSRNSEVITLIKEFIAALQQLLNIPDGSWFVRPENEVKKH